MRWTSVRAIRAHASAVFAIVADPVEFQRAVGADPNVHFLTDRPIRRGTRFRASRVQNGRETTFEQEVVAYEPGRLVRMVNTTHGVVWDSTFEVEEGNGASTLRLTMDAITGNPLRRLLLRVIARMVQRALDRDMDAVRAHAERE